MNKKLLLFQPLIVTVVALHKNILLAPFHGVLHSLAFMGFSRNDILNQGLGIYKNVLLLGKFIGSLVAWRIPLNGFKVID